MLSDKVEKRIASSIFITLAPPRRDHLAKGDLRPLKPLYFPCNYLPKEVPNPTGRNRLQIPAGATKGDRGCSPGAAGIPNGGHSSLPSPPILSSKPVDSDLGALCPPPRPLLPASVSVETLGPDLEKQAAPLPASLQTSSTFPMEQRPPDSLPSNLIQAAEQQTGRKAERAIPTDICAFCHKALSSRGPAIEAMKKQYHADCFTCRTCHCALEGQRFYQKEGRPLCGACYESTLEKCARCQALILNQIVRAMGNGYHPECFTCFVCGRTIGDETFAVDKEEEVYCLDDFYRKFASVCGTCKKPIIPRDGRDSYKIECMGQDFHEDCYRCESCRILLSPEPTEDGCYPLGTHLLCKSCNIQQKEELLC